MDITKMLQDMESNLTNIAAKVDYLIARNAELEAENSELKKDNQIFRNYIDNESISKRVLRNHIDKFIGRNLSDNKDWGPE
jgi:uncharacterized protein YjbK